MKGQKFLKVTSILMIIGGVLAAIIGLLAFLGISALVVMAGSAEGAGLLYASSVLAIVSSIIELIAGMKWGIIIVALSIVSMVIGLIAGGSFSFTSLVLNLIVPGLYIYGAIQMKNA